MPEHERRRQQIMALIATEPVATQGQLVQLLRRQGIVCTQASVSRDIKELGLIKQGGRYAKASAVAAPRELSAEVLPRVRAVLPAGDALVVIKTNPGEASLVAIAVDAANWPSVVGTVAGDDTVFVACPGHPGQKKTIRRLQAALAANAGGERKGTRQ
ncbi:MAG: arginine repressor [Myxococcales bacterium]|nr:arginine repressor [Myxococcales bacterium]